MIWTDEVTTIAGDGTIGFRDGRALEAQFSYPSSVAISNDDTIFIGRCFPLRHGIDCAAAVLKRCAVLGNRRLFG